MPHLAAKSAMAGPGAGGFGPLPHLAAKSATGARCHVPEASAQAVSSTCACFASVAKTAYPAAMRSDFTRAKSPPPETVAAMTLSGALERAHTCVKKSFGVLDAGTHSVRAPLVLLEDEVVIA